jgi:hypothetical protein
VQPFFGKPRGGFQTIKNKTTTWSINPIIGCIALEMMYGAEIPIYTPQHRSMTYLVQ